MGNTSTKMNEDTKQWMRQIRIEREHMDQLELQQETKSGPVYDYLRARERANFVCSHPFRLIIKSLYEDCIDLRMEEEIKRMEKIIFERDIRNKVDDSLK